MKKWTALLAGLLLVCFTAVGFAANDGWHKGPRGEGPKKEWTQQQKNDFLSYMAKKNSLRAEFLKDEVAAGRMKKDVADAHILIMNDRLEKIKANDFKRPERSEQERAAMKNYQEKMKELKIQHIKDSVANGSLTKEQGDRMIERIEKGGFGPRHGGGHWGYGDGHWGYGDGSKHQRV